MRVDEGDPAAGSVLPCEWPVVHCVAQGWLFSLFVLLAKCKKDAWKPTQRYLIIIVKATDPKEKSEEVGQRIEKMRCADLGKSEVFSDVGYIRVDI